MLSEWLHRKRDPSENEPTPRKAFQAFDRERPAVLFVVPWLAPGGAEQVVLQVMQGLAGEFSLAVASTLQDRHEWSSEFRKITPWVYDLGDLNPSGTAEYLRDVVEGHGIQAVIISHSKAGYEALPSLRGNAKLWIADIVHNTVKEGYLRSAIRFDAFIDLHFAVGRMQAEALESKGGIDPAKIRVAPTSADARHRFNPDRYRPELAAIRGKLGLEGNETVLTYVGRLAPEKDVPLFIRIVEEIARRNPDQPLHALIVGDGPERLRVEQAIDSRGLRDTVRILGFSNQVPEILAVSHYAFLTSKFEGSSITLLEAMSMKLVVMATDVGGVREVIQDGVNGFVVTRRKPGDFAERFERVQGDPDVDTRVREAARKTVLERFELSAMQQSYAEALRDGLKAAGLWPAGASRDKGG